MVHREVLISNIPLNISYGKICFGWIDYFEHSMISNVLLDSGLWNHVSMTYDNNAVDFLLKWDLSLKISFR